MLIDINDVLVKLTEHNIVPRGVLHVGAHECEELTSYNQVFQLSDNNVVWIEAMKHKVEEMKKKGIPNVFNIVVSDQDNKLIDFNETNNGQSSSILPLGTHLNHHPHIHVVKTYSVQSITIDTFIDRSIFDSLKLNFWNLDIQGAELLALHGAKSSLKFVDAIYTEINEEHVYKGACLVGELDTYLATFGFKRVMTNMTQYMWGDALYVKIRG